MDRWVLIRCPYAMNTISLEPIVMPCLRFILSSLDTTKSYNTYQDSSCTVSSIVGVF
jgi:hypothetical protein